MIRIRAASCAIGLLASALLFSPLVCAQGKTPVAKGNSEGNPAQVQVGVYPGDSLRALLREAAGAIPVVIFSSATFNAANVNPETIFLTSPKAGLFGNNGNSACHAEDANRDGRLDLVCTIQTNAARARLGKSFVALEGQTNDGARFRGGFPLQLLPGPPARPAAPKN